MSTNVGTQSSKANIWFFTVPGLICPCQRTTCGARKPPSQAWPFWPLNGVTPPSGKVIDSAPLSVVKTTIVLSSCPICSNFANTADIVVELLHAGFLDAPVLATFFAQHVQIFLRQHGGDVHACRVVPDKEGLLCFLGIVAVEEVDDLGRDFLVDGLRAL